VTLTVVLSLILAGGIGALALSRQPAAQAEGGTDSPEAVGVGALSDPALTLTQVDNPNSVGDQHDTARVEAGAIGGDPAEGNLA